jgi:DNA modification methylase
VLIEADDVDAPARKYRRPSKAGTVRAASTLRLSWGGRSWVPGAPRSAGGPIRIEEQFGASPRGRVVFGDSLDVARSLADAGLAGKVDLVYVDPPFASQAAYTHEVRLDGPANGRTVRVHAYDDAWPARHDPESSDSDGGVGAYLDMLAPRLEAMCHLLAPTGSIWVHADWRAAYLVRVLLDEIMGRDAFLNEVVWRRAPNLGRQAASGQFGRTLDTIVVYGGPKARLTPPTRHEEVRGGAVRRDEEGRPFTTAPRGDYTDESMERLAREGRVHTTASGKKYVKYFVETNADGAMVRERRIDTLWTDVPPLRHAPVSERTGFPTQKPRALLERIIRAATPAGGTVVDLCAGSGTTGEGAHALGRTFILGDCGPVALNTTRARLLRAGASFTVESCGLPLTPTGAMPAVDVKELPDGALSFELARASEPLGWAIGTESAGGPFVAALHGERRLGAVPTPAPREAVVPGGCLDAHAERISVRVYEDDGTFATSDIDRRPPS